MKKIYLLGFLCMMFPVLNAAPRDISFSEARQLKVEGKVRTVASPAKQKVRPGISSSLRTAKTASEATTAVVNSNKSFFKALKPQKSP